MDEIVFKEENHSYTVNGKDCLSVTTILKYAGIAPDSPFYTEKGKLRGRYTHKACELLDENDLDYSSMDPAIESYIKAYELFLKENDVEWEASEERVYNKYFHYVGTLDRRGFLNAKKAIVDIKTGVVQPWAGLQIVAYSMCFEEPVEYERWALQLKSNGKYKLHRFIDPYDSEVFKAACDVAKWKEKNMKPLSSRGNGLGA